MQSEAGVLLLEKMPVQDFDDEIREKNLQLLQSGQFSDFKIICGECVYNVHRAIISAHSPFFEKAVTNGFKESHDNVLDLSNDDPFIIALVIRYMYGGSYRATLPNEDYCTVYMEAMTANDENSIVVHAKMYSAADKFMMKTLKEDTWKLLRQRLVEDDAWADADWSSCFLEAAKYIFGESGTEEFKEMLAFVAELGVEDHAVDTVEEFQQFAASVPEFSWLLLKMRNVTEVRVYCSICCIRRELNSDDVEPRCFCALQGFCSTSCGDVVVDEVRCVGCGNAGLLWAVDQQFWTRGVKIDTREHSDV